MRAMLRPLLSSLAVLLLASACGGKDKAATTTPGGSAGSGSGAGGMPDDPDGLAGGDPGDVDLPDGSGGDDGDGDGDAPADGTPAAIVPPNLDPDPAEARTQVGQQLELSRTALRQTPPDGDGALRDIGFAFRL